MSFDKKNVSRIEEALFLAIIDAHRHDKMSYIQMKKSASYIIRHTDHINSSQGLINFLHNLARRWPVFEPIFEEEKTK